MQEILLKIRYCQIGLSKSLVEINLTIHVQNYEKQKRPGTSDQSLFKLKNKFKRIPALVMNYLTKLFLCYSQNSIC